MLSLLGEASSAPALFGGDADCLSRPAGVSQAMEEETGSRRPITKRQSLAHREIAVLKDKGGG